MPYRIMIFNQRQLGQFSEGSLLAAITASDYGTLCQQYGLDPALIQPSLDQLAVEFAPGGRVPYFMVRYQPGNQPPIVVTECEAGAMMGSQRLEDIIEEGAPLSARGHLSQTRFVCTVELVEAQLTNLGLLLAYELARWAAARGCGIVLGLEGAWYRLNTHQAFILLSGDAV